MDADQIRQYTLFNKLFLVVSLQTVPLQFYVKCGPEYAIELRKRHHDIIFPGYHMNKKHCNTIILNGRMPW